MRRGHAGFHRARSLKVNSTQIKVRFCLRILTVSYMFVYYSVLNCFEGAVSAKTLVPVYHIILCHVLGALSESLCNGYCLWFRFRSYTNYLFIYLFIHSFINLFIYSFIHSCIYLFTYNIPKSIYRSSSNGYRNSQRIRISNLALCNREPVTKIGSLE